MTNESWAEIFIEECIKQNITVDRDIIQEAKENTDAYQNKVIELLRSRETEFTDKVDFTQCSCGSEMMYDSGKEEFYCPMCD